jgi:hypothetical protein
MMNAEDMIGKQYRMTDACDQFTTYPEGDKRPKYALFVGDTFVGVGTANNSAEEICCLMKSYKDGTQFLIHPHWMENFGLKNYCEEDSERSHKNWKAYVEKL